MKRFFLSFEGQELAWLVSTVGLFFLWITDEPVGVFSAACLLGYFVSQSFIDRVRRRDRRNRYY